MPWTSSIDGHLRRAARDIQAGTIPDWFKAINDFDNRCDTELWEDWMREVLAWFGETGLYDTELAAYQLLRPLQAGIFPVFWRRSSLHHL